jgi:Effector protein
MRYWGPNILIDGAKKRSSLDNQPLTTFDNAPAAAESYEERTQGRLREVAANPAGKILLDAFTGLSRNVTLRPLTEEAAQSFGAQAEADSPLNAQHGGGSASTIWYDSMYFSAAAMKKRDPGHHWRPDDILFHECVHAMRQILGVWHAAPMPEWKNQEEFYAVMMTNIYLSRAGREADMRGDYSPAFRPLDNALRYGYLATDRNRAGQAFASKYNFEIVSFRSDTFNIYQPFSQMPLGWNPLREYEAYWDAAHDYSPSLQMSAPFNRSEGGFIPLTTWGDWWRQH